MNRSRLAPFLLFLVFFLISSLSVLMAGSAATGEEEAKVHIVYVQTPEGEEDPEAFHMRTLSAVIGSEDAAKEALVYHYKHAASGFSAKLTPQQVEDMSKQPGVLQVVPSQTYQLHGGGLHRMGGY